jgi:hypothetical protein
MKGSTLSEPRAANVVRLIANFTDISNLIFNWQGPRSLSAFIAGCYFSFVAIKVILIVAWLENKYLAGFRRYLAPRASSVVVDPAQTPPRYDAR